MARVGACRVAMTRVPTPLPTCRSHNPRASFKSRSSEFEVSDDDATVAQPFRPDLADTEDKSCSTGLGGDAFATCNVTLCSYSSEATSTPATRPIDTYMDCGESGVEMDGAAATTEAQKWVASG